MARLKLSYLIGLVLLQALVQGSTIKRFPPLFEDHAAISWENPNRIGIESKEEEPNYRLPNNTIPIHYDVSLTTKVGSGDFNFKGKVVIKIKVDEDDTKNIVVHARQLKNFVAKLNEVSSTQTIDLKDSYNDVTEFLTLTPKDNSVLKKGKLYEVTISYEGKLREDNGGFYLSSYVNAAGKTVYLATTQFESTDSRHAFPCYDEPAKRATFTITINHDKSYKAISNMPVDEAKSSEGVTVFKETPSMPSYLLAFVVSDFEFTSGSLNDLTQRIFSRKGTEGDQEFALFAGIQLTARLAEYYNVPFTLPKLDQVAVPDFAAGAMENWGIATYREEYLLYNPEKSTINTQTNIANIIAHEYTHMWFGDLVTLKWWTYLWLKEGFATLFSYKAADEVYPEWDIMQMFIVSEFQRAIQYDSGNNPRPMTHYVQKPKEISSLYDSVSYQKAGSVLHMWQNALTDSIFRAGLNKYLKLNEFTGAEEDDLFNAIQTAAKDAGKILPDTINVMMKTWTNQGGVPLLTVTRNYENNTFEITQNAFHKDTSIVDDKLWYIPINYATKNTSDFRNTTAAFYLKDRKMVVEDKQLSKDDWLILNKQSTGYYRVQYDEKNWGLISESLIANPNKIHPHNRASLLYDAYHLSSTDKLKHGVLLQLMLFLKNDDQYAPWATANSILTTFNSLLSGDEDYASFKAYVADLVENIYNKLGVHYSRGEHHFSNYVRSIAIKLACLSGIDSCLEETNHKLKVLVREGIEIEPNLQSAIYCNGLKQTGDEEFDFVYKRLMKSQVQAERKNLISSLGCAQHSTHVKKFIESSIDESSEVTLRVQERITLLSAAYSQGEVGLMTCIDFLMENHDAYSDLTGGFGGANPLDTDIKGMSTYVVNDKQKDKLLALVQKVKNKPGISSNLEDIVNANIKSNYDWLQTNRDLIMDWVAAKYKTSGASSSFSAIVPAIVAACYVIVKFF